ncbi:MAG: hypothetical protein ABSF26_17370 [Thermoguttaceae bacterium]
MSRAAFILTTFALLLLAMTGCNEDERAQVNRSQAEVAEASRKLVEADAKARTETIAMQRDLQKGQDELGRQRDQLENDRRQYADQRNRDPILANTILDVGLILACLLPLVLCIFLVLGLRDKSQTDSDLADVLVQEIVSEEPFLLPPPDRPRALPKEPIDEEDRSVLHDINET